MVAHIEIVMKTGMRGERGDEKPWVNTDSTPLTE